MPEARTVGAGIRQCAWGLGGGDRAAPVERDTDSGSCALRGEGHVGEQILQQRPSELCVSALELGLAAVWAVGVVNQLVAVVGADVRVEVSADRRGGQQLLELARGDVEVVVDAARAPEAGLEHASAAVVADRRERRRVDVMELHARFLPEL